MLLVREGPRTDGGRGQLQRAGLVATNSIRGGANRKVLDAICTQTSVFEAWSDEPWINEGAAVRVSLVAFGENQTIRLNGQPCLKIFADLTGTDESTAALDLSTARRLTTNANSVFEGLRKDGLAGHHRRSSAQLASTAQSTWRVQPKYFSRSSMAWTSRMPPPRWLGH